MQPLISDNLREKARLAIRAGIITGDIPPGSVCSARALATQLGVSATPVREALLDLVNEGLVTPVRNRGFQVRIVTERDLDEILEMRLLLEVPGTLSAVGRLPADALAGLRALAEDMEQDAAAGDVETWLAHDLAFHLRVLQGAGNRRLVDAVRRLREQTLLPGLGQLAASRRLSRFAAEHHEMVDALAAGDGARLERIVRTHLQHSRGAWAGREP